MSNGVSLYENLVCASRSKKSTLQVDPTERKQVDFSDSTSQLGTLRHTHSVNSRERKDEGQLVK